MTCIGAWAQAPRDGRHSMPQGEHRPDIEPKRWLERLGAAILQACKTRSLAPFLQPTNVPLQAPEIPWN